MSDTQHRLVGECRAADGRLSGVVMRYGSPGVGPDGPEVFTPGAFGAIPDAVPLNLQHDGSLMLDAAAELRDSTEALMLESRATPEGVRRLVKRGALTGLSVEFRCVEERQVDGVREIVRADLLGVGLVDVGAYRDSVVEARALIEPVEPVPELRRVWL